MAEQTQQVNELETKEKKESLRDIISQQLRQELNLLGGTWYAIHTYSGHERKVKTNLEQRIENNQLGDKILRIEVPMERVTLLRNAQKKRIMRVRIPGYVLVLLDKPTQQQHIDEEVWHLIRETPAVTGFVGDQYQPIPLTLEEVVKLLTPGAEALAKEESEEEEEKQTYTDEFQINDVVIINDGPFIDMEAQIAEINMDTQKLIVNVTIFERETPIELGFDQVRKPE